MTKLPPALEALMPVPFDHLYEFASPFGGTTLRESASEYNGNRPKRAVAIFTADQMREAILAATERAAKVADENAKRAPWLAVDCAAAIRGTGSGA